MSLERNNSKKSYLPSDKRSWPAFSHFIESNRPQGTFYKDSQGFLKVAVEVIGSYL